MLRDKPDQNVLTLYYHLYLKGICMENICPDILPSVFRMSLCLSVSHKSVQCLSASVNNK